MSIAVNEHTGHRVVTRKTTDAYKDGWEAIFGKRTKSEPAVELQGEPSDDGVVTGGDLEETAG